MSFKRTIIIAAIFLILGGFYYFYEIKGKPQREEKKEKENAVFTIKDKELKTLTLNKFVEEYIFEKNGDDWIIKKPAEYKGDKSVLDNLARSFINARKLETVEENATDLKKYGLETPKFTVTLSDGKNQEAIEIGNETIDSKSLYAKRKESKTVFLIDSGVSYDLKSNLTRFRDKTVIPVKEDNAEKVVIHLKGTTYLLEKKDKDWTVSQPRIPRLSVDNCTSYIKRLLSLNVAEFLPDDENNRKRLGMISPENYVEVYEKGKTSPIILRFTMSEDANKYIYARIEGGNEIFQLNPGAENTLNIKKEELIQKSLFTFDTDNLFELSLKVGNREIALKKEEQQSKTKRKKDEEKEYKWVMLVPEKKDVENPTISGIIANIRNLYIQDAIFLEKDLKEYGFDKPLITAVGKTQDGKELFTLTVGSKASDPNFYYVRANAEDTVETLKKETVENLQQEINKLLAPPKSDASPIPTAS